MPLIGLQRLIQTRQVSNLIPKVRSRPTSISSRHSQVALVEKISAQIPSRSPGGRNASTSIQNTEVARHSDTFLYGRSGLPVDLENLLAPKRRHNAAAWVEVIDAYLPAKFRLEVPNLSGGPWNPVAVQPIDTLPQILAQARQSSKVDLLSYLGVYQGRWEAVMWLVTAMMEHHSDGGDMGKQSRDGLKLSWLSEQETLETMTNDPIHINAVRVSNIPLDQLTKGEEERNAGTSLRWRGLGQIWQSLGVMILQAADRSPEDPSYSLVMTQVFRILAHLHRISAFPDTIYNYVPALDQTVLRRPPTLHLLSRRIMSALSDVEFNFQWEEEIVKYQKQGYDLAKTTIPPKVREFGPELWLDLVLWACVEGGWVSEGVWIIGEVERRKSLREKQWSVISWEEICARKAPKLDWTSILKLEIDRTRLNQVGSIGIASGSDSTVDMGTRTISQEVVQALVDGLLNIASSRQRLSGQSFSEVRQNIATCRSLLERGRPELDDKSLNSTVLRLLENTGIDARHSLGILQQSIDLRAALIKKDSGANLTALKQDVDFDEIAAMLGLLHRCLYGFAQGGNLQASLAMFRKIQNIVDNKREETIQAFAETLRMREQSPDACKNMTLNAQKDATLLSPLIPVNALVAFVNIITDSKYYDLGYWLLQNQDTDGGPLSPELYSDRNFQPALLHFATAVADNNVLTKILEKLETPLSEEILHALLQCQIVLGKWSGVEELLEHFQKTPGMTWKACDAMALARAILRMEHGAHGAHTKEHVSEAQDLLCNLVRGKYNSDRDPSELPDLTEIRLANQIGKILSPLPGSLSKVYAENPSQTSRCRASIPIPPDAFNIVLEALVECHGPSAGKSLWKRWCNEPGESSISTTKYLNSHGDRPGPVASEDHERVVHPKPYMVRNILRPILKIQQRYLQSKTDEQGQNVTTSDVKKGPKPFAEETDEKHVGIIRSLKKEEQEILDWGIEMYSKFGMSEKEIRIETSSKHRERKTRS